MTANSRIKSIERTTNMAWEEWLQFMNSINASDLSHHEIATHVLTKLDGKLENHAWWAQSVTVAYEQYIGRRIPGQRSDGKFQASVSKSTKLNMQDLMNRWVNFAAGDEEILAAIINDVRVSGTEKRITWRTKSSEGWSIRVTSEPKKNGTASIVVNLIGLETHQRNIRAKSTWASIIQRFIKTM